MAARWAWASSVAEKVLAFRPSRASAIVRWVSSVTGLDLWFNVMAGLVQAIHALFCGTSPGRMALARGWSAKLTALLDHFGHEEEVVFRGRGVADDFVRVAAIGHAILALLHD